MSDGISYRDSGVDLEAARRHTAGIAPFVTGGVTGFASAMPLPPGMRDPLIVSCTDGVGTKLLLALEQGRIDGLGQDLVAMSVNDLVCCGATPLFFLDYLAVGRLDPDVARVIVESIAVACAACDCTLVGGETAELPGLYRDDHFDLAGFAVGVVERDELRGPHLVRAGDVIIGLPSSGVHSNGYSLVRALVREGYLAPIPELLEPTRLYPRALQRLRDGRVTVHAAAHITGGGLPENLPRAVPEGLRPVVDPRTWPLPKAIEAIMATGRVTPEEAWSTFNMGLGMCLIVPESSVEPALTRLDDARVVGWVEQGSGGLRVA
ncbi:MAG: phosphoribosylformylglycinamidine cyclo-ligase [Actinomycetota bacterium]